MLRLKTLGGLWIESSDAGEAPTPRPRRIALLAILAAAGEAGASRDRLLGVLWPERDEGRARHALSQTLYSLRRDLGVDVVVADAAVRLDRSRIGSDLGDFRAAMDRADWTTAAGLYRGPFLDGFYLQDAPAFEQWVDGERQRVLGEAAVALEEAHSAAAAAGDIPATARFARRLVDLDPLSARFALRYMEALAGLGDRAGALNHERAYAAAVRDALDADPEPEVTSYAESLRGGGRRERQRPAGPAATAADLRPPSRPTRMPRIRPWQAAALAAGLIALALWLRADSPPSTRSDGAGPTLAVGRIRDLASPDSSQVSQILADMLTTSLGRLTSLEVIATSRLLELLPAGDSGDADARALAARHAGAAEIIEGEVAPLADGRLQFDFRRVDLIAGIVRRGYRVSGTNRFDLIDSATTVIAADLRRPAPVVSIAEVTTRSPIAFRYYEDGLRAFYQLDQSAAARLFRSALREDSTFAMAAYYAWRSAVTTGDPDGDRLGALAAWLSSRATARDRLIVRAHIAAMRDDPSGFAAAESLAAVYPNDPEALARAADVFRQGNEPLDRVVTLLRRATTLDSTGSTLTGACRSCAHLSALASVFRDADSIEAAESALRRWARFRPADPAPWLRLGRMLDEVSEFARADTAFAAARSAGASGTDALGDSVWRSAARGDGAAVAAICREAAAARADQGACRRASRTMGRLRDALLIGSRRDAAGGERDATGDSVTTVMLDFESGRVRLAAESFRGMAREAAAGPDGRSAAAAARYLALAAAAHHAATDSLQVKPLLAQIEELESRALSGRRFPLASFARALLLAEAGRHGDAAIEFAGARGWAVGAFPRIDREMARNALAAGRPADAIVPLRAALRARPEGWGASVNHGDLRALLGDAFAESGQTDSARVHYQWVARAWRGADPPLDTLQRRVQSWLDADARSSGRGAR